MGFASSRKGPRRDEDICCHERERERDVRREREREREM
jgi:hypothetical protein